MMSTFIVYDGSVGGRNYCSPKTITFLQEIQRSKTELYTIQMELKNIEATNETIRSQLVIANERANSLNKTVTDRAANIRQRMFVDNLSH